MGFETTLSKHYKKDRTFYKVQSFSLVFLASNLSCATTKCLDSRLRGNDGIKWFLF